MSGKAVIRDGPAVAAAVDCRFEQLANARTSLGAVPDV
jgi:hypothetical protein